MIEWDRLMTVSETAEFLGVNRARVDQLIKTGKLDARKIGEVWIVDKHSVARRKKQSEEHNSIFYRCPHCHEVIGLSAIYCSYCGKKVKQ